MLSKEDFAVIQALATRGVYQKDIAEDLGVSRKTVGRALKRGGAPPRERAKRGSKLLPYQDQVDQLLAEGVWNAVVILREIQAVGYADGVTVLRDFIAPKRALRSSRATVAGTPLAACAMARPASSPRRVPAPRAPHR